MTARRPCSAAVSVSRWMRGRSVMFKADERGLCHDNPVNDAVIQRFKPLVDRSSDIDADEIFPPIL